MKEKCAFLVVLCLLGGHQMFLSAEASPDESVSSRGLPVVKSAPLIMSNLRLYTKVSINGAKEVSFLVDNGWHQTAVDSRLIDEAKFQPKEEIRYRALHKKGQVAVIGCIQMMELGDMSVPNAEVMVSDIFEVLSKNLKYRVRGVLGFDVMEPFLTTFDFRNKRLCLAPNTPEAVAAVKEHEDLISIFFSAADPDEIRKHVFKVNVEINGIPGEAFIDLGFPGCILTSINHSDLGLYVNFFGRITPVFVMGQSGYGYPTSAAEVRVGSHVEKKVGVLYFDSDSERKITLIGVDFLRRFNVTFDYKNGAVYLVPHSSRCADKYYKFESCRH